jgi:hypothetical protein
MGNGIVIKEKKRLIQSRLPPRTADRQRLPLRSACICTLDAKTRGSGARFKKPLTFATTQFVIAPLRRKASIGTGADEFGRKLAKFSNSKNNAISSAW